MTALPLAGKGRVVAKKRATRDLFKTPFPRSLNVLYKQPYGTGPVYVHMNFLSAYGYRK
jgi:hypothetical protein